MLNTRPPKDGNDNNSNKKIIKKTHTHAHTHSVKKLQTKCPNPSHSE